MSNHQQVKPDKTEEKVSPYRMGWIVVLFDLPVTTDVQRREAARFRKFLLDDAYVMKQFSVYIRPCVSHEHMEKHTDRLRQEAPHEGFVTALFITDKQYEMAINFVGDPSQDEGRRVTQPAMPDQIVFW